MCRRQDHSLDMDWTRSNSRERLSTSATTRELSPRQGSSIEGFVARARICRPRARLPRGAPIKGPELEEGAVGSASW
eukprot:8158898-Pyramimonas_sp.AAC.1